MKTRRKNPHIGGNFEDFLKEQGILEEVTAYALKRVLAWELAQAMKKANVSQAELARRMKTSRAVVHRLLNDQDTSVTLQTLSRAAAALKRTVKMRIVPA